MDVDLCWELDQKPWPTIAFKSLVSYSSKLYSTTWIFQWRHFDFSTSLAFCSVQVYPLLLSAKYKLNGRKCSQVNWKWWAMEPIKMRDWLLRFIIPWFLLSFEHDSIARQTLLKQQLACFQMTPSLQTLSEYIKS